jgi:hypothetical protein
MPIIAKESGNGTKYRHPEGVFAATCIDVIDLGEVKTTFKDKDKVVHKVVIRFWAGERNEEQEPLYIGERFTLSLSERANLRKFLDAWRGRAFTEEELEQGFDLEKLLGVGAYVQVTHRKGNDGNTYANITSAMRLPQGVTPPEPLVAYIRVKDRDPKEQEHDADVRSHHDDSDLPF